MTAGVLELSPVWEYVSDRVMGGVSSGGLERVRRDGHSAVRLTGRVSLENNGGFVQMAFDLASAAPGADPGEYNGLEIELRGNDEPYDLRLRTAQLTRPWQSFRKTIMAEAHWRTHRVPYTEFVPHRTEASLRPDQLRRIGLLGIGRAFEADVMVRRIALYRSADGSDRRGEVIR